MGPPISKYLHLNTLLYTCIAYILRKYARQTTLHHTDRQMNASDMVFYFTLARQRRRRIKDDDLFSIVIFSQHVNHFEDASSF